MKSAFKSFQIFLLFCGVFGADADEVKSVMEGDSVTLNPDLTQIQKFNLIKWRFGDPVIAQTDGNDITYYSHTEIFRDRLQLDQTGSLTIKNMRTKHSGLYKLQISHSTGTANMKFNVSVHVPGLSGGEIAGIVVGVLLAAAVAAGVMYYLRPRTTNLPNQTLKVMEEDDVTLNPDTEIQTGDEIQWLFGAEDTLIAEIKGENREKTTHEGPDERFKNRLELDETTGSLTIESINTEHTGLYTLKIRRGRETFYKRFIVSVEEMMRRSVREGNPVTLHPCIEIQKGDEVQWLFGDEEKQTLIAEIKGKTGKILTRDDVADERFRGRLELDETTGSLTITNTRTEHSGVYRLQIISSSEVSEQTFIVTVYEKVEEKLLKEDSVTLNPDTEIQSDDQILWMFGDQDKLIAQMKGGTVDIYDDVNKRFRGRLELDEKTGSLTITDIEAEHTGLYKLLIISSRGTLYKKFKVSIKPRNVEVTPGESVHLYTGLTEIQTEDEIQWRFGDKNSLIAEIKGGTGETHDVPDERFRDRLQLDEKTGDLIIKNSTYEHTGLYKLKISSSEGNTNSTYRVFIKKRKVEVTAGESVRLNTDLNEIQRGNEIEWRFGDKNSLIAEIKGGTGVTHDGPDERFRDRLELNKKTGDLIIKNSTAQHTGDYKLKIRRSGGTTNRTYGVNIRTRKVEVTAGESVRLHTGLTEIQTEDEIQWRFGDKNSLIAKMNGGTGETHDVPDKRFRDRLELDKKTGDLIIKNSTYEHTGYYKLKIRRSGGTTNSKYSVNIRKARTESLMKEKTDSRRKRVNESVTVEMEKDPLLNGDYVNVVNEEEGTSSL